MSDNNVKRPFQQRLPLTRSEQRIVSYLKERPGTFVRTEEILAACIGEGRQLKLIHVYIHNIRKKGWDIEADCGPRRFSIGYRWPVQFDHPADSATTEVEPCVATLSLHSITVDRKLFRKGCWTGPNGIVSVVVDLTIATTALQAVSGAELWTRHFGSVLNPDAIAAECDSLLQEISASAVKPDELEGYVAGKSIAVVDDALDRMTGGSAERRLSRARSALWKLAACFDLAPKTRHLIREVAESLPYLRQADDDVVCRQRMAEAIFNGLPDQARKNLAADLAEGRP